MEHMYSQQLIEQFKSGRKEFSGIHLNFCTLDNIDLSGLVIRDSKLEYTAFWHSNLNGAKFINCEMFFASFYTALLENAVFDNCKMEMTRFDSAMLKNTKIINSRISYSLCVNANIGELDMRNTSKFKWITDPSSVSDEDIIDALRVIGNRTDELPIEIKSEIQRRINSSLNDFGRDPRLSHISTQEKGGYEQAQRSADIYKAMGNFTDGIIKYGSAEVYKDKKSKWPYG